MKKIVAIGLVISLLLPWGNRAFAEKTEEVETASATQTEETTYRTYNAAHAQATRTVPTVIIAGDAFSAAEGTAEKAENIGSEKKSGVKTGEEGFVEWQFDVPQSGLYQLDVDYYPVQGKGTDAERKLMLDGALPFKEAGSLTFTRVWESKGTIEQDNRGNDKYPQQVEVFRWCQEPARDASGFYADPFLFFLEKGTHMLRLEAVKEPLIIGELRLHAQTQPPSYEQALAQYAADGLQTITLPEPLKIQAELADYKSSPVLSPVYDRSSPLLEPYDGAKLRLNILGGGRFSSAGMWVEYVLEDIPADGLYQVVFKARQTAARGLNITRRLYVNGVLPFKEAGEISFPYSADYENVVLGDKEAYYIALKKGRNVLRVESTLGELGLYCSRVTEILLSLNEAYRKLVVITGTNPDLFRDYMIEKKLPDVLESFVVHSAELRKIADELETLSGENSSYTAILRTVALQLEKMYKKPSRIPREVSNFNSNLSSLGTWVNTIKQTNLDMDYLLIASAENALPKARASFFQKLGHEARNFMASFFEDYNSIGDQATGGETITVWINSGRDQAQILKQMIDSDFTPTQGITVDMKLVQGALLQATVAGRGPDVALTVGQGDPINYAIRGAAMSLNDFSDFPAVRQRFSESAMTPVEFGGKCYGLPERATFPMLFYRKDILDELGIDVPETWEDVYEILPILQRNNMNFGLPVSDVPSGSGAGVISYGAMLYQKGASFYSENGSRALFDSEDAVQAMKQWSNLYVSYGLPLKFDFVNRFASGEMPLAVTDYTAYNTLTVFAPQIRNMWGFTAIPGTRQEDGSVSHAAPISIQPCMIMAATKKPDAAWTFLKWWTSSDVQATFGHEIECLVGEAGRYPTANQEAMMNISWPLKDLRSLQNQFQQVVGIPEVPGGYYTWRHLDNAFREIINNKTDAREVMVDYNKIINEEIAFKRDEFHLD